MPGPACLEHPHARAVTVALEAALRELATGLTDDDINGLGNLDS